MSSIKNYFTAIPSNNKRPTNVVAPNLNEPVAAKERRIENEG